MGNGDEIRPAWTLWIGCGDQAELLKGALTGMVSPSSGARIESLTRRTPSLPPPTPRGRAILEVETIEPGDLADIEAFLGEATGWELVFLDRLGLPHLAQRLIGPAHIRWWPGSLTLEQTQHLLQAPGTRDTATLPQPFLEPNRHFDGPEPDDFDTDRGPTPAWEGTSPTPHSEGGFEAHPHLSARDPLDAEMGAIRAILEGGLDQEGESESDWDLSGPGDRTAEALISETRIPDTLLPDTLLPDTMLPDVRGSETRIGLDGEDFPSGPDDGHPLDVLTAMRAEAGTAPPKQVESLSPREADEGRLRDRLGSAAGAAGPRPNPNSPGSFADDPPVPAPPMLAPPEQKDPLDFPAQAKDTAQGIAESTPPDWYQAQVADLNDYVQRLQLDMFALDEIGPPEGTGAPGKGPEEAHSWQALREDVARLGQFARTLGFVAAPPATGGQRFSLPTLVQEQLTSLSFLGPEAPRFLFRTQVDAQVRSDKGLLVGALDAILQVAGHAAELWAGASGTQEPTTIRVECSAYEGGVQTLIHFPPGPIAGWSANEIFEPYRLKGELPEIGPNALRAARSIVRGQGGELSFHPEVAGGTVSFRMWLPTASGE